MKKLLLLGIVSMLIAPPVSAQLPASPYLALYEDAVRTDWCVLGPGLVNMYLFVLPSTEGAICAELSTNVTGPGAGGLMWTAPTYHADIAGPVMGTIPGEMGVCFLTCKTDWVYFYSVGILVSTAEAVRVEIGVFGTSPYPKVLTCDLPAEELEGIVLTHFYINDCGPIAVEASSWGAIKSLYE